MSAKSVDTRQDRMTGWRAGVVWLAVVLNTLLIGLASAFAPEALNFSLIAIVVVASFAGVGAIVVTGLPSNPIGWILVASGSLVTVTFAGVSYAAYSTQTCDGCLPATIPIAFIASVALIPVMGAVALFIPLLFPNGHLPSPRWRPVAALALAGISLLALVTAVKAGPMAGTTIANPIGILEGDTSETPLDGTVRSALRPASLGLWLRTGTRP